MTFGAPPTVTADVQKLLLVNQSSNRSSQGLSLAFVNEFDIVPRADQTYVRSLIDLYRSVYNLPPQMTDAIPQTAETPERPFELPPLNFGDEKATESNETEDGQRWRLPKADYNIIGDLVLLRKEKQDGRIAGRILRAHSIATEEFQKLLFCGVQTHSRTYYGERVGLILEGNFNNT